MQAKSATLLALLGLGLTAGLSGCMVGTNYARPAVPTATACIEAKTPAVRSDSSVADRWWEAFSDPVLSQLVETADAQNLTLRAAGIRVIEAQARRAVTIGYLFPQQQTLTGAYTHNVVSESTY